MGSKLKAYIASPFFNPAQLKRLQLIKNMLKDNKINFFSPKDHNLIAMNASQKNKEKGFEKNINMVTKCNFVVAITNDKDMGTLFECGYAFAKDIPIVYIAFGLKDKPFNLMLANSAYAVCKTLDELRTALWNIKIRTPKQKYIGLIE